MIIDFTISNFRSIKDEQTFSLYAENVGSYLTENVCYPANDKIGVLKSAGIYGANASGKSNLLQAFQELSLLVSNSSDLKEYDAIAHEPFLLSEDTKSRPTFFEIEFILFGLRYKYTVSFTRKLIEQESLIFYPSSQPATIFKRVKNDTWDTIKFGSLYKGGKKRFPLFVNNLYLSKAGNSADAPKMIRDVYNYFRNKLSYIATNEHLFEWEDFFINSELKEKISKLLFSVDTGISKVSIIAKTLNDIELPDDIPEDISTAVLGYDIAFSHSTDSGNAVSFDIEKESEGTQKLFRLAPWFLFALDNGGVIVIDELDSSMHPFMAELIIKLFNDPRVNKGNAQLIFSTHNINLMSPELLRRDQIWFTEKNDGATTCYSLDDFDKKKVKPQSPFNLWYAEGRFGAVPAIDYEGVVALFEHKEQHDAQKAQ